MTGRIEEWNTHLSRRHVILQLYFKIIQQSGQSRHTRVCVVANPSYSTRSATLPLSEPLPTTTTGYNIHCVVLYRHFNPLAPEFPFKF